VHRLTPEPAHGDERRAVDVVRARRLDAHVHLFVDRTLDESEVLPAVEQVLERKPSTLEAWVRRHAEAFRA
jgi:predicted amidohydrolase YtcJ